MKMNKLFLAAAFALAQLTANAQDPACGGIQVSKTPIAINETATIDADFLNNSSTPFAASTTVTWTINTPPAIEVLNTFVFDNPTAATYVDVVISPWDVNDGQLVTISTKTGIAFPGNAAYNITLNIVGKIAAVNQPFSIQSQANPAVGGTNSNGNDLINSQLSVTGSPLPVKLSDFSVTASGICSHAIKWIAGTEHDMSHYEVEHSNGAPTFATIARQDARSTAGASYTVVNSNVAAGANYYRLKMIGKNGSFKYSNTISLISDCHKNNVMVAPNLVTYSTEVKGVTKGDKIMLRNTNGERIFTTTVREANCIIDMSQYPAGVYYIEVLQQGKNERTVHTVTRQ